MTIEQYKAIAQKVADQYLNEGGELPKLAAVAIKESGVVPLRGDMNRIAEYINNAVQVGLFKGASKLETFPVVTPEAISVYTHTNDSILPVQNHLPETNKVSVPVTDSPLAREMAHKAQKVRRTEELQRRVLRDSIERERAKAKIEDILAHRERLDREITGMIASIAGDVRRTQNPAHAVRMIRIIRLQVPAPLGDIIKKEIGSDTLGKLASYEDDGKKYNVNTEHPFIKKIAALKKAIGDRKYTDKKMKLYLSALAMEEE